MFSILPPYLGIQSGEGLQFRMRQKTTILVSDAQYLKDPAPAVTLLHFILKYIGQ